MSTEEFKKLIAERKAWARGPRSPEASRQHNVSHNVPRIEIRKGEDSKQALARAKTMGILG